MFRCQQFFQNKVQIHFNFSKDVFDFLKALETLLKKIHLICRLILCHHLVENVIKGFQSKEKPKEWDSVLHV